MLQSRAVAHAWLLAALLLLVVSWQQLAGWPLARTVRISVPRNGTVNILKLPRDFPAGDWNNAMVRVTSERGNVRRFVGRDYLEQAAQDGYVVRGNRVFTRATTTQDGAAVSEQWKLRLPWLTHPLWAGALLIGFFGMTWLLLKAGNPLVRGRLDAAGRWLASPGVPWIAASLAAVGLLAAIGIRVFGLSFPAWYNDTPIYMKGVSAVFNGHRPVATLDRPFGYPTVMGTLLRLIPDLRAVVALQALASLATGAAIGAIVWKAGERLFASGLLRGACRILGVLTGAALVLNEAVIEREWTLLAEPLVTLYLGCQALLAWHLARRPRRLSSSLLWYALFCACGFLAFFTKPNWGLALGWLPIPWIAATLVNATSRRDFVRWSASGAAIFLLIGAAAFGYQASCTVGKPLQSLAYRARALVCWHIPLVRPEIDRRLAANPDDPEKPLLEEMSRVLDEALVAAKTSGVGAYPSLGYDADRVFFKTLPSAPHFRKLTLEEQTRFCAALFKDALRHRPDIYLHKVGVEMSMLFTHPYEPPWLIIPNVAADLERSLQESHDSPPDILAPQFAPGYRATVAAAKEEFTTRWPSSARLALSQRFTIVFEYLRRLFPWSLGIPAALVLFAACSRRLRQTVRWRAFAPVVCLAVWSSGSTILSALTSAVTQGLDIQRYIQLSIPLTLLSQVLWPVLALAFVLEIIRARSTHPAAAHREQPVESNLVS